MPEELQPLDPEGPPDGLEVTDVVIQAIGPGQTGRFAGTSLIKADDAMSTRENGRDLFEVVGNSRSAVKKDDRVIGFPTDVDR
jgi:hypothetical protein